MNDASWFIAALIVLPATIAYAIALLQLFRRYCVVHVTGAGREIFVGIHGRTGEGVVLPHPSQPRSGATLLKSPLVRTLAFVDPDRDEVRLVIFVAPVGLPESVNDEDKCQAELRVSWSIPGHVPFVDEPDRPGDHGEVPWNLRETVSDLPTGELRRVFARSASGLVIPGAAAVTALNDYLNGEHLVRMFNFTIGHTREIFGTLAPAQLMPNSDVGDTSEPTALKTYSLPYESTIIRDQEVRVPKGTGEGCINCDFRTGGELQAAISRVLTWIVRQEMEPYGVFVNDITVVTMELPARVVQASRAKVAEGDDRKRMTILAEGLAENVQKVVERGMDPNIAGLVLADATRDEQRTAPIGALATLGKFLLQSMRGK